MGGLLLPDLRCDRMVRARLRAQLPVELRAQAPRCFLLGGGGWGGAKCPCAISSLRPVHATFASICTRTHAHGTARGMTAEFVHAGDICGATCVFGPGARLAPVVCLALAISRPFAFFCEVSISLSARTFHRKGQWRKTGDMKRVGSSLGAFRQPHAPTRWQRRQPLCVCCFACSPLNAWT